LVEPAVWGDAGDEEAWCWEAWARAASDRAAGDADDDTADAKRPA
jgi:hypothetical protein